jgi:hypothetical protein
VPDSGLFEAVIQIEATAVVTHPPGTTIDEDGNLIPPPDKDNTP